MIYADHVDTLVIGGGQAGLAMGYELARRRRDYLIVDANPDVGDAWRSRWDSLTLFTQARYSSLPDLRFPGPRGRTPSKDDVADYLEEYCAHFELNIRSRAKVTQLRHDERGYRAEVRNEPITARSVVLATGAYGKPIKPDLAGRLDPSIRQFHSSEYRHPGQLAPGPVLVVGAGNSGAEIALELVAAGHETWLAGRETGALPTRLLNNPAYWWLVHRVLTMERPYGRAALGRFRAGGSPLIRNTPQTLREAGVRRVLGRVETVAGGLPVIDGERPRPLPVANVLWCTGFAPDYQLLGFPVPTLFGHPVQRRGRVSGEPGLYLLGVPFAHALTSSFIGGVGRDAAYIAKQIGRDRRDHERARSTS